MEVRLAKTGPTVAGVAQLVAQLPLQLSAQQAQWLAQLRDHPETFAALERNVHGVFQALADQVVAGLLAETTKPAEWGHDSKKA